MINKKEFNQMRLGSIPIPLNGTYISREIPKDFSGIEELIKRMIVYVGRFGHDPTITRFARFLTKNCSPRDNLCKLSTLYNFLKKHTQFAEDPYDVEMLVTPVKMLSDMLNAETGNIAIEDCDSLATLTATLISALGIKPIFIFGGNDFDGLHHVWAGAILNDLNGKSKVIHIDLTVKELGFGEHFDFDVIKYIDINEHLNKMPYF